MLKVQVSLADDPRDAEREVGWVSTGWDREPANTVWLMGQDREKLPNIFTIGRVNLRQPRGSEACPYLYNRREA